MKAKYLFISLALVSVLCACTREEESLFDKSAAERSQEALENAHDVLIAPANGWEMLYFANTESRGYSVLVKFMENGRVFASAKNDAVTNDKLTSDSISTWQVALDYGPILTFDTYNSILHAWADPRDDGDGLLGDYEFLILHANAESVKLKGKKHSSYNYLYPLAIDKTPAEYFAEVEATNKRLFNNGNLFHFNNGSEDCLLFNGSEGIFYLTKVGELPDEENLDIYPFATLQNGIQLMDDIRDCKDTKYELRDNKLVSATSSIYAQTADKYFDEYMQLASGAWTIDIKNHANDSLTAKIAIVDAALKAAYTKNKKKASVQGLRFKRVGNDFICVLSYIGNSTKANDVLFTFDFQEVNGGVQLAYSAPTNEAAQNVIDAFPSVIDLLHQLDGTFAINADDAINPTLGIHMNENSNSERWFDLTGKIE